MPKLIAKNSKNFYQYQILKKYTTGIKLLGSEVKSIKNSNFAFSEAYCFIKDGELYLKNMFVSEYKRGGKFFNHQPLRDRKLLLTKKEINELEFKLKQKGLTIVPLTIILADNGYIKMEIGLVKGKTLYDKRMSLIEKEHKKQIKEKL